MWESCLSGSERDRSTTVIWMKYCGTAAKVGGNRENKLRPGVMGVSYLLKKSQLYVFHVFTWWMIVVKRGNMVVFR